MPETAHSQSFKSQPDSCAPFPPVHVTAEIEKREVRKAGKTGREARLSSAWRKVRLCNPARRSFSKPAARQARQGSRFGKAASSARQKLQQGRKSAGQQARQGSKFGRAGSAAWQQVRQGRKCGRQQRSAGQEMRQASRSGRARRIPRVEFYTRTHNG